MSGKLYVAVRTRDGLQVEVREDEVARRLEHVVRHSSTGFDCGYGGSGPADLARCLLLDHLDAFPAARFTSTEYRPEQMRAAKLVELLYQRFKNDVVAALPPAGFVLQESAIAHWVRQNS